MEIKMVGTTHPTTTEPQNVEQGILNDEVDFVILYSIVDDSL
jgi:hypothetical protein